MRSWIGMFLCALTCGAMAQNPIISEQFTADPTARVFNDRVYLYPSHDIPSPVEDLRQWFCMADYHVFSSSNLVDWNDHGVIVSQDKVAWVKEDSYTMWAPDCVYKDGKYYFYFPACPKGVERRFGVGVAVADRPDGPFLPMPQPIKGVDGIDPCVLVDKDGQAYIYWAGNGLRMARLKPNMMELASEPKLVEGLPEGFKEGPFVFERDGKYYFTFPWVRKKDGTETLAYAMGDHPMGPFYFKGVIMDESPTGCWTNHHSIVEYQDQWYLFYHHNDYSPEFDKCRSVRVDSLRFLPDGTIKKVVPTLRGVGATKARSFIKIDRYSTVSPKGVDIDFFDEKNKFKGWKTCFSSPKAYLIYNKVDFGMEPVKALTLFAKSESGATLELRANGPKGKLIAQVKVNAKDWQEVKVPVINAPQGIHDLYVSVSRGRQVEVYGLYFDLLPWSKGAFETQRYRNFFAEMGYKQKDIDQKLKEIFEEVFMGPTKVFFEVGDSLGYICDVKNHDVRTEGMSYGMMIAVQFGRKDIFDRLWRWSKKYMQHQDGALKGYFAWSCKTDGTRNAQGPASDGELYYVTSLLFASNRWGNHTGINYLKEAQNILDCSMQKVGMSQTAPLIDIKHQLITFTPDRWGGRFTDPSYHVPAFYEVWAQYAQDGRSEYWMKCAEKSREFLHRCVNPQTGLTPDYCNYDGSLLGNGGIIGDAFRYDSWRVPMNVALDYSWSCKDREWQQNYGNTFQNFLYSQGIDSFVDQYNVDGSQVSEILQAGSYPKALRHSIGLLSTTAALSLVCTHAKSKEFVEKLWNARHIPDEDGYFDAYYDGLLRLFAFMHLSGKYQIIIPKK